MQKVTPLQIYMLFTQFLYATTVGFYIRPLAREAGFSAWISVFLGSIAGMLLVYLTYRLAVKRPTQFFGQYGQDIMGKPIHILLTVIMVFSFLFSASYILRELLGLMAAFYLQGTPTWAVAALFGICIARVVRSGIGTIFRGAQGLFFFSVISAISIPFLVNKKMNGDMAIALLTNIDPPGIWNGTILMTALFGEMVVILFFFPHFAQVNKTMKSLGWATFTSVIITLCGFVSILLLFGPDLTANLTMPTLEMIRYVKFGSFFQNLDPLLIVFWLYSMFIKISLFLYTAVIGLTHILGLKDHKPLSTLMTAAMVILSLYMVRSVVELDHLLQNGELAFLLITEMIPLLYLIVDWIRSFRMRRQSGIS
ncbi:GerAB/ArcD/ProY family transporter [Paenibacillus piri]|uniref:Spore gernimation protein n=1 Tax=Paenibacillus piri TaxID=2547395 RepID=A0A4R5KQE4_9BACL|nr:endospore germination permease [Paenibacillus piri]TDF97979.1 spore gernimation protein [Paenibacillus piri]